jgi:hypothetical protein
MGLAPALGNIEQTQWINKVGLSIHYRRSMEAGFGCLRHLARLEQITNF